MNETRGYQTEALDGIGRELAKRRSTLVVMPTGTGKTVVFAKALDAYRGHGRGLVIAHREELISQAKEKIEAATALSVGVEMGDEKVSSLFRPDVVVASVQTLAIQSRRAKFRPDEFALIVVDEAHHATASTYRKVLDYFTGKILGVTATPDRLDGKKMRAAFESVAYVYEIRDAIDQGYLVPIRQKYVEVEHLDLATVKRGRDDDFTDADLERAMMDERVLHEIAAPLVEQAGDRRSIVFSPGVQHAHALASVINRYRPGSAMAIDGGTDSDARKACIAGFHAGAFQFLCNCALLIEGFDAPPTSLIAVARPTNSRSLYAQMVGRGTRTSAGKTDLLVLDFVGDSHRHKLATVVDILDGGKAGPVRDRAVAILSKTPGMDALDALRMADGMVAAEARQAELDARRAPVTARVKYSARDVDPFLVLGASSREGRFGGAPATERQREVLERNGINVATIDKGQASALMEKIIERRAAGLCTFKMACLLARCGVNPDLSFEDAKEAIDAIKANGWRAPTWLLSDPRFTVRAA